MNNNEAVNNQQATKKKSNVLWIVFVALIIVAMAVEGFIIFNKGRAEKDNADEYVPKTADQFADEYLEFNPDATREEALELFNRDLGKDTADMLYQDGDGIDYDKVIEYCENGDVIYIDDDGNEKRVTPRDAGKTDADFDKELEELLKGIEDGTYGDSGSTGNNGSTGNTGTGEVEHGPDTSDPGAYNGGQPDDTVYDPTEGEDKTDPRLVEDTSGITIEVTKPGDVETIGGKDYSGLNYGISG